MDKIIVVHGIYKIIYLQIQFFFDKFVEFIFAHNKTSIFALKVVYNVFTVGL